MKTNKWIENVVFNAPEDKKAKIKRELEVKVHDMMFSNKEDKVLEKLGDPNIYYQKHYSKNNDSLFYKVLFFVGLLVITLGILSLVIVFTNISIFDTYMPTAFGVKAGPIYFGGMLIGIGIVMIGGSILYFKKNK